MEDPEPSLTPEQSEGLSREELIPPNGLSFYIYTKKDKVYMMIEGVEWELPAGIEEMQKIIKDRDKLQFAVKVYKVREKESAELNRKDWAKLHNELVGVKAARDYVKIKLQDETERCATVAEDFDDPDSMDCGCGPIIAKDIRKDN